MCWITVYVWLIKKKQTTNQTQNNTVYECNVKEKREGMKNERTNIKYDESSENSQDEYESEKENIKLDREWRKHYWEGQQMFDEQ